MTIRLGWLGQSGLRLATPAGAIYVDPYLSHSVEKIHGPDYARMQPVPVEPEAVDDAGVAAATIAWLARVMGAGLRALLSPAVCCFARSV